MKKLLFILLLFASTAYAVTPVSTTDGGGNADTLEGQSGSYYLDAGNITGDLPPSSFDNISANTVNTTGDIKADGFIDGLKSMAGLSDDNAGLGVRYDIYTTFTIYTSYDSTNSSSNITADASAGTITLDSGVPGEFMFTFDASITGVGEPDLIYTVFRNDSTVLLSFTRPISGIHHHPPAFALLSSNAAYDTYSSLEFLIRQDGDYVVIEESADASNAFIYDLTFNDSVLYPEAVEYLGIQYTGQAAHEVEAQMWNYSTTAWVDMRATTMDFPDSGTFAEYKFFVREYGIPPPISSYVDISAKESKSRIIHTNGGNANDRFRVDKVQLHDSHGTSALSFRHGVTMAVGDFISVKVRSDRNLPIYVKNWHLHLGKESN